MIEIIKSFAAPDALEGLFEQRQSGEVKGKYLIRHGACNLCGKCCTNIYLVHDEKAIESVEEFARLLPENPEYEGFTPIDTDEHGVRFRCRHLSPENRCTVYNDRPSFCRKYPSEKGILLGGQLADGCGYSFEVIMKFEEILAKTAQKQSRKQAG